VKVIRTIVIEGNPSWVKRTLELSCEDIRLSWHQFISETKREIFGENETDQEYYHALSREPGNSIEEHETKPTEEKNESKDS